MGNLGIEDGAYAFVRHPEFLGHILMIDDLRINPSSATWVTLILGAILIVLLCLAMIEEEKRNVEKFGNEYKDSTTSEAICGFFLTYFQSKPDFSRSKRFIES